MALAQVQEQEQKRNVKVALGTMEFGRPGRETSSESKCAEMVDEFLKSGSMELDTALLYMSGESEKIIGRMPIRTEALVSTKVNPWVEPWKSLSAESVRAQFQQSLASLQLAKVDILYLHAPDHATPIEETLGAIDALHKEGKFLRFGLSNYAAWQVVDIYHICRDKGYVLPTVYQGMYNALTRDVEKELFPALRRCNMSFYAYNPLAGGILSGRYQFEDTEKQPEGRFFGNAWAERYRERFWNKTLFESIERIKAAIAESYGADGGVGLVEAALRWLMHHSRLSSKHDDAVILGVSSLAHFRQNCAACLQGPLDARVVAAFEDGWQAVVSNGRCPQYFR